jgi:hypothetical protein
VAQDPLDYDCHQFLGDVYGFHEDNDAMGSQHKDIAARLVPSTNPKALMFKAKILVFMNKREDACQVMDYAYSKFYKDKIERRRVSPSNDVPVGKARTSSIPSSSSGGRGSPNSGSAADATSNGVYTLLSTCAKEHSSQMGARSCIFSKYADVIKSTTSTSSSYDSVVSGTTVKKEKGQNRDQRVSFDKLTPFERAQYPAVLNNWVLCEAIRRGIVGISADFVANATVLMEEAVELMYELPSMKEKQKRANQPLSPIEDNKDVENLDIKMRTSTRLSRDIEKHLYTLRNWRAGKGDGRYEASFIW